MSTVKQASLIAAFDRHVLFANDIPADTSINNLEVRLKTVQQAYEDFVTNQEDIEEKCKQDKISEQFDIRAKIEEHYFLCIAKIMDAITVINDKTVVVTPLDTSKNQAQDVKLPRVELIPFSGLYEDWPSFKDLYSTLYHNNALLKKVQKLYYLKTNVEGDAYTLLKSIHVTEANYDIAWKKLTDRYDHKRYIVDSHLKTLLSQPIVKRESHEELKQLIDKSSEIVQDLEVQGLPVEHWDAFLVHVVVSKLDSETHKQWELILNKDDIPTFKALEKFLESRWQSLEMISKSNNVSNSSYSNQGKQSYKQHQYNKSATSNSPQSSKYSERKHQGAIICSYCNKSEHRIGYCPEYTSLSQDSKSKFVKTKNLCFNCLKPDHSLSACSNKMNCQLCGKRHHTSLHRSNQNQGSENSIPSVKTNHHASTNVSMNNKQVLLATALVNVKTASGRWIPVRALIDKGSDNSIIQENLAKQLGFVQQRSLGQITGVGGVVVQNQTSQIQIQIESSINSAFRMEVEVYTMKTVTGNLPTIPVERKIWPHLQGIKLADKQFNIPSPVQLLLGAEVYEEIILDGIIKKKDNSPTAMNSTLGWLLFGKVMAQSLSYKTINLHHSCVKNEQLDSILKLFWELEEVTPVRKFTVKEQQAEEIFLKSKYRNDEGRYVVALPFDPSKESQVLGESKSSALYCLYHMEKRFESKPIIKERYVKYIQNLIESNHIELVPADRLNVPDHEKFYLPHHPVLKESSLTTKLRVVFNASRKTKSGISLNDKLLIGPRIQEELFDILIRWRKHKIVFIADVEKMYRQVKIINDHRDYQRVLWRFSKNDPVSEYRVTTVIDGTASAQFLATRALNQLADDMSSQYPEASQVIKKDFYVDDLSSGTHDIQAALNLQNDLIRLLKQGGFVLRKWFSNDEQIMSNVPEENRHDQEALVELMDQGIKTLGVFWSQKKDCFEFKVSMSELKGKITKREVLSDIAKLFDPIGWLAPSTIVAKIFLQKLWCLKELGWDDRLPEDKVSEWHEYRRKLPSLEIIKIPRWIGTIPGFVVQFHGFADASTAAYAAVVYVRLALENGSIKVYLISSKTKVTTLKTITIPKLELCGCVLLASLMAKVKNAFQFQATETYLYSDSQNALAWIHSHPNHWNIFVANRITDIHQSTDIKSWRFVEGCQNPADCASRGVSPDELENHPIWWKGPSWLSKDESEWPKHEEQKFETDLERRKIIKIMHSMKPIDGNYMYSFLQEHSNMFKLLNRTVFLIRWLPIKKASKRDTIPNAVEIRYALNAWIKFAQMHSFHEEIVCCQQGDELPPKSKLRSLRPFVDENGILRVGGRLSKSNLSLRNKYPIILPKKHHITKLIIEQAHQLTLHGGPSLMSSFLSNYWIFGKSEQIKRVVRHCITCFPYTSKPHHQIMADLPKHRVTPSRIFVHSGVDFAGPILTKSFIGRCRGKFTNTHTKSYIAIFVCFSTKAIHLELVSNLTSPAFLAAFKRFTARRGKVSDLYSDCGSNFIGADRILREHLNELLSDEDVQRHFARDGTTLHFNPPSSPHFGGIWEAGVKSTKYHLKRLVGDSVLTFEEMTTVLCQIEACLNSRPLCPMNNDINDNSYLTPGHFILGEAPITVPEPSLIETKINRLTRWQLVQRLYQEFWKYWSADYLSKLQQRPKWMATNENIRVGQMVLYREDNVPPAKWPIARILEVHPGDDKNVRVVTLKTPNSCLVTFVVASCVLLACTVLSINWLISVTY